jgi:hypothetical protein
MRLRLEQARRDRSSAQRDRESYARAPLLILLTLLIASGATCDAETAMQTRPSSLAGTWYPESATELARSVDEHIAQGAPLTGIARRRPVAIIAPHAGHRWSGAGAGHVYRLLAGDAGADIERVILIGPSHYQAYRGVAVSSVQAYATPLGDVPVDTAVVRALLETRLFSSVPAAERQEHSLEIQLPFLQRALSQRFRIVPLLVSQTDPAGRLAIARALAPHIDERTLVVVSSDFTHYGARFGYLPFTSDIDMNLRRLDKGALAAMLHLDAARLTRYEDETDISVCGIQPIGILLELLNLPQLQTRWNGAPAGRVLDYYRSADLIGEWDGSVSYAAIAFFRAGDLLPGAAYPERLQAVTVPDEDVVATDAAPADAGGGTAPTAAAAEAAPLGADEQRFLLELARRTIREVAAGREAPRVDAFPDRVSAQKLRTPTGVFVTLTEGGDLRGCIGHIIAQAPLVDAVIDNAVNAAFDDPRFSPVIASEIDRLHIEISVLTPLRAIAGPQEIVVGRDGVLLERGGRRAVFLPQVAPEQGWDRDTMLDHLSMKAGLPRGAWREGARFQVFQAFVFGEPQAR